MKFIDLQKALKDFTIFSINDVRNLDEKFSRTRLNEWQDKGYIKKIIRGYYIFSDIKLNEKHLFRIANKIYNPSYISFEMALSYYNLIPESVYSITSASTRKTYNFKTPVAEFSYRTIKPDLFFGYDIINCDNGGIKIASMEKAILDYFYINSHIKTSTDFASLRINEELFAKNVDEAKLFNFVDRFAQKTIADRINSFMRFVKNA